MAEEKTRSVSALMESLRASKDAHLHLFGEIMNADGGQFFGVDLVVGAVLQRSLCLINGFCVLIEQKNLLCAAPVIRLQVDSLIRLNACRLVQDPHSIAKYLLEDLPLGKVKSGDGKNLLNDSYLKKKASEDFPWVEGVYNATSGFIHLSTPHMLSAFRPEPAKEGSFTLMSKDGPEWTEAQLYEAVDTFHMATVSLFHLCESWLKSKKGVAAKRSKEQT